MRGGAAGRLCRCPLWAVAVCLGLSGCTSILSPINGVPARRLPPQFLPPPQANKQPIDISRLRQEPPRYYLLDADDILGVYIEGVLGTSEEPPPVHFPDRDSDLPPAIGYPIPVREDGTLPLPLADPLQVRGLTLSQTEAVIRKAYTVDRRILQPGRDRIIVTLIRERTHRVIVVRQDGGSLQAGGGRGSGGAISGSTKEATGHVLQLKAYQNDVMHALAQTGGLPGLNAKNEVKILRGKLADAARRDDFVRAFYEHYSKGDPCICAPPLPDDPSIVRIPLRLPPGEVPTFLPQDVILNDGDIVYIESRETEFYYTGGLLGGGQHPLPRDYDLDVLGAMAMAGQGIGGGGEGGGGGGGGIGGGLIGGIGGAPPTQLYILRRTPCGGQVTIVVDLNRAITNPNERLLIQPGDTLILRYKFKEEVTNFSLGSFFTFGITELFRR